MCVFVNTQYLCSWIFPPLLSFWLWSVLYLLLPNILTLKKKRKSISSNTAPFPHAVCTRSFFSLYNSFRIVYFINHNIFFKNQYLKAHTHKSLSSFTSISPSPSVFILFAWICTDLHRALLVLHLDYLLII